MRFLSAAGFFLVLVLATTCEAQVWNGHFETAEGVRLAVNIYDPSGDLKMIVMREYESRRRRSAVRNALQAYYDEACEGRRWRGNIGPVEYVVHECDYWTDDYIVSGDKLFVVTNVGSDIPGWGRADASDEKKDEGSMVICYQLPR